MVEVKDFAGRDFLSILDFSRGEIEFVLDYAADIDEGLANGRDFTNIMKGKSAMAALMENSSRTRESTRRVLQRLGSNVALFDPESSSRKKGESLIDTFRTFQAYDYDLVLLREKHAGSSRLAADILRAPVINLGDGDNEHPTQAILDIYTMRKHLDTDLSNMKIAIAGDLRYGRTVHSLSYAISKFPGNQIFYISPENLRMPKTHLEKLNETGVEVKEHDIHNLEEVIADNKIPIVYMTRVQRERYPDNQDGEAQYKLDVANYRLTYDFVEKLGFDLKIMHPLPKIPDDGERKGEIDPRLDDTEHALYYKQMESGIPTRMAECALIAGELDYAA